MGGDEAVAGILKTKLYAPRLPDIIPRDKLMQELAAVTLSPQNRAQFRGLEREDDRIAPVLEYIRRHYKKDLTIAVLAEKAGLHPMAFLRRFKRATGLTPRRYVLIRKIEQAKDHLLIDNIPFFQTAEELGFCDYSNFHRTFKKFTGMTPQAYYKTHRPA